MKDGLTLIKGMLAAWWSLFLPFRRSTPDNDREFKQHQWRKAVFYWRWKNPYFAAALAVVHPLGMLYTSAWAFVLYIIIWLILVSWSGRPRGSGIALALLFAGYAYLDARYRNAAVEHWRYGLLGTGLNKPWASGLSARGPDLKRGLFDIHRRRRARLVDQIATPILLLFFPFHDKSGRVNANLADDSFVVAWIYGGIAHFLYLAGVDETVEMGYVLLDVFEVLFPGQGKRVAEFCSQRAESREASFMKVVKTAISEVMVALAAGSMNQSRLCLSLVSHLYEHYEPSLDS